MNKQFQNDFIKGRRHKLLLWVRLIGSVYRNFSFECVYGSHFEIKFSLIDSFTDSFLLIVEKMPVFL